MSEARELAKRERKNKERRAQRQKLPRRETEQPEFSLPPARPLAERPVSLNWIGPQEESVRAAMQQLHATLWRFGPDQPDPDSNDAGAQQLASWMQQLLQIRNSLEDIGFPASSLLGLDTLLGSLNDRALGGAFPAPNSTPGRPPVSMIPWQKRLAVVALFERSRKKLRGTAACVRDTAARDVAGLLRAAGAMAGLYGVPPGEAEQRRWIRPQTVQTWRDEAFKAPVESDTRKELTKMLQAPANEEGDRALLTAATGGLSDLRQWERALKDDPGPIDLYVTAKGVSADRAAKQTEHLAEALQKPIKRIDPLR